MSHYFFSALLLIFFLPQISNGQSPVGTSRILNYIIRPKSDTSTFLYTDKVDTFFLNKIKLAINTNELCGSEFIRCNTFKKRCIKLTQLERIYILSEIDRYTQSYWKENVFPDSKLISLETLHKIKDKTGKISLEGVKYNQPIFEVYEFTNPIFFKDGKYFLIQKITFRIRDKLFQIASVDDDLSVYKQEGGVWKRYFFINGGILDF